MNRYFVTLATLSLAIAAVPAMATDSYDRELTKSIAQQSGAAKTRAEVQAELKDAIAKGQIVQGERGALPVIESKSSLNRVDVQNEAIAARKSRNLSDQERG